MIISSCYLDHDVCNLYKRRVSLFVYWTSFLFNAVPNKRINAKVVLAQKVIGHSLSYYIPTTIVYIYKYIVLKIYKLIGLIVFFHNGILLAYKTF